MVFTEEEREVLNRFHEKKLVEEDEEYIIEKFSNSEVVKYYGYDSKKKKFRARLTNLGKRLLNNENEK